MRRKTLESWRQSLQEGDPVNFISQDHDGINLIKGSSVRSGMIWQLHEGHVIIKCIVDSVTYFYCVRLLNELYPFDPNISQAPQGCDLGLTRPTAKRQVDHSGQERRAWYKSLPGISRLFSFMITPAKHRPTVEPGGSPERG